MLTSSTLSWQEQLPGNKRKAGRGGSGKGRKREREREEGPSCIASDSVDECVEREEWAGSPQKIKRQRKREKETEMLVASWEKREGGRLNHEWLRVSCSLLLRLREFKS